MTDTSLYSGSLGVATIGPVELSTDALDQAAGGFRETLGRGMVIGGGALGVLGAGARYAALIPTPLSPGFMAFGTKATFAGAGLAWGGTLIMMSRH